MLRRLAALLLVCCLAVGGAACSAPDDGTSTANALAAALGSHTVGDVAFDVPAQDVQRELTELAGGLDPVWPAVSVTGVELAEDSARVSLNYSWDLPGQEKPWTYATGADMQRSGDSWTVTWSPEMVAPQLKPGERLQIGTTPANRAAILSADGEAIVKERPVRLVGINKEGLTDAEAESSAQALAAALELDGDAYVAKVKAYGPVAFVDAITLREEAFAALDQSKLDPIKGVLATAKTLPLAPSRTFAQAILGDLREATAEDIEKSGGKVAAGEMVAAGGLQAALDEQLAGKPGLTVSAIAPVEESPAGTAPATQAAATSSAAPTSSAAATSSTAPAGTKPASAGAATPPRVLFEADPVAGKDVTTTLVQGLQSSAEQALAGVESPSSIVVMRPSSGAILAAANGPGSAGYNTAFLGQYAPGSTFKIATSLGLLRLGTTPQTPVPCTTEVIAGGKKFLNAPGYPAEATGNVPLTTAVAKSCNTAFVSQFEKLPQEQLADAAGALGIGMENDLGLDAYMGSVPRDSAGTEHAASMIGQGKVQVSPLAMATVMSTVVKGSPAAPVLIKDRDGKAKPAAGAPLTAQEAADLATMMAAVVSAGGLNTLAELPGSLGKTGTAEYGNETPPRTHSWVIAAQGDLAVAVFVEDGDLGAVTAGPIAKSMLTAAAG